MKIFGPLYHPERYMFWGDNRLKNVNLFYDGFNSTERVDEQEINVFAIGEPKAIKKYKKNFLEQFDVVISHRMMNLNTRLINSRPLLQTFCGLSFCSHKRTWSSEFKDFKNLIDNFTPIDQRTERICCIISNKKMTRGHQKRLKFIKSLKNKGAPLDLYGVGFQPVGDKYEILSRYRYNLVIENSVEPGYVSEKLTDGLISGCYNYYYGDPTIETNFEKPVCDFFHPIFLNVQSFLNTIKGKKFSSYSTAHHKEIIAELLFHDINIAKNLANLLTNIPPKKSSGNRTIFSEENTNGIWRV
jgi:hypothetical protein